jgi:hypothetical protein
MTTTNPWMTGGWFAALAATVGGLVAIGNAADPLSPQFSPFWASLGPALVIVGGVLFATLLAIGAINWQARERERQR